MKRKKLETFMKSICVVLSATMLVTSIPVNAAGVSENSVDTVTEVSTESNSDTDTNADVDVKNEADNTEETNTEVDTESATDEEIVETDVETEDGQDNGMHSLEELLAYDLSAHSEDEINEYFTNAEDEDVWLYYSSLSEAMQQNVMQYFVFNHNVQYAEYELAEDEENYIQKEYKEMSYIEYLKNTFNKTATNVWKESGTSKVGCWFPDTPNNASSSQKITYMLNSTAKEPTYKAARKFGIVLAAPSDWCLSYAYFTLREGTAKTVPNPNAPENFTRLNVPLTFHAVKGYSYQKSSLAPNNKTYGDVCYFTTDGSTGYEKWNATSDFVDNIYLTLNLWRNSSIGQYDSGGASAIYIRRMPITYQATFTGVGSATWTYGSSSNVTPEAPTAPKLVSTFTGTPSVEGTRVFNGWEVVYSNGLSDRYGVNKSLPTTYTSNVTFNPVWGEATIITPGALADKTYTVTYNVNGGNSITNSILKGKFTYWLFDDGKTIYPSQSRTITNNTSATAQWANGSVTLPSTSKAGIVSYNANGGTCNKAKDIVTFPLNYWSDGNNTYKAGASYDTNRDVTFNAVYSNPSVTLPTATKTGYTFKNWSVDAAKGSIAGNTLTVKDTNVTATANYTANTYTVKYNVNGGNGEMADQAMTYDKDSTLSDNVFTRDNYTFRGWSTDPNGSAMYTDKQSVKNLTAENGAVVTLYAVWTKNQYTINFDGNGGSVTTPSMVANMGEDVQLPTATKQYKVDYILNGGYLVGSNASSETVGATFKGWATKEDLDAGKVTYAADKLTTKDINTITDENGESVATLYAVWEENASVTLPQVAKDGYKFINWGYDDTTAQTGNSVPVTKNMTFIATWKVINGPIPTPTPTPSKDYTEEMKNILNILQNITTTQDLTSQQISQLTTLIKEVCFNDVDPAVIEKLVNMIKNSNLSENVKKAIFEALASGSISEDLKSTLIDAIKNSNLSEYEKSQLISAIEKMSTLSLDEQKKILQLLTQGSSVTYKIDGIEYILKKNADGTLTIGIKNLNGKENVVIPDSVTVAGVTTAVTEVSKEAFKNNTIIKTVTMGNNVTKIGDSAFEGCKNLKSVTIGPAVTNIGNKAFKGCTSLTKINIPKSVLKIGNSAFEGCSKLKTVIFHEGLLQIGNKAFYKCSALTKVKLPKSLLKAGSYAFSKCKKLKTVTFATDANVTTLGKGIFADNASFKTIKIPSKVTAISTKMFRNDKKLSKVTGLSGVTKINANAFENCKSLKTITLQKNVQTIGSKAFYNCSKLSKVTIKSNAVTSIGSKAFKKCKKAIKFKVPNSKVKTYKKLLKGKY